MKRRWYQLRCETESPPPVKMQEAQEAIESADQDIAQVNALWGRVNDVSETIIRVREKNHLAMRIRLALGDER